MLNTLYLSVVLTFRDMTVLLQDGITNGRARLVEQNRISVSIRSRYLCIGWQVDTTRRTLFELIL
jgi:hypothetical protein